MKKILRNIRIIISILLNKHILRKPEFSEKVLFLNGKLMAEYNKDKTTIGSLKDVEFSVFSQFGEDGIIDWIVNKMPAIEKTFIEIGTQDYWESNTRFLLKMKNWKGYLFEASKKDILKIKSQRIYWQHKIKAIQAFVNKENIDELIAQNIKEKNIGLLSIDIDGNDYWILQAIKGISPFIIVCEFNSIFGDKFKLSVPYDKDFKRNEKHHSNLYFGSSIKALISLLNDKGYTFIGTGSRGVNAFFIKDEFKSSFLNDIKEIKIFPSTTREARNFKGKLTFNDAISEINNIQGLEVFDFDESKTKKISEYEDLYSEEWKSFFK
tara:strand:+ start:60 stop:1028 length:969 start_codon:yes stop_codon:yes gene_type:complete